MSQVDLLSRLTAALLIEEERNYDVRQQTLISLVRANYDVWTKELFPMLEARGASCYGELVNLLGKPEVGIKTNREALRKAFQTVREERSQAGSSGVILAPKWSQRARYSRSEPEHVQRSNPPALPTAVVPQVRGEERQPVRTAVPASVAPGSPITWSVVPGEPVVFNDMELDSTTGLVRAIKPIKATLQEVAAKGSAEDVLACLAFLKALHNQKDFHSVGEGENLRPQGWMPAIMQIVENLKTRFRALNNNQ